MICQACRAGHRKIHLAHSADCHLHPANNPGPEMETTKGNRRRVIIGNLVQSPRTARTYSVTGITAEGRLKLWKHGWRRIDNAVPENWLIVEVVHG